MPTYEYRCGSCEQHVEVVQSFSDDPLTECGSCGGPLRKVFSPVGIVFKGSGFYKTDSRGSGPSRGGGVKKDAVAETTSSSKESTSSGDRAASSSSSGSAQGSGESPRNAASKIA